MIIQRNQMPLEIPTGHSGRAWTIMKMLNNSGPNMDPCGTPYVISFREL